MKPLSTMQERVFKKLSDHKRRTGSLPDLSAFARELGMHYVSLKQHLEALAKKGYLIFESKGRGRSPILELPAHFTGVPVVTSVTAGFLSGAIIEPESYLPLTGFHEDHFALRVDGDSMADLIQDNDVVLFNKRTSAYRSGDICAVRVDESSEESSFTLKYLDKTEDSYILRPHNPEYPTVEVDMQSVTIEGIYLGLLRGEVLAALVQDKGYYS